MSTPIVGVDAKVTVTKGEGQPITLLNSKYKLDRENKVGEAHNCVDKTRRVPGRRDASGSVEGFQDVTNAGSMLETNVEDGDIVTLKLFVDGSATKCYSLTAIVSKLHIETGIDDVFAWSFDFSLASGVVANPAFAAP